MNKLSHILLVEDEPDIREVAVLALSELGGFSVSICSSGKEALEQILVAMPQLVLLDVMMPEMDGPTTLKQLRATKGYEKLPVIFMTARVQTHEVEEYLQLGALGVIQKPFDPATLAEEINKIWENYQLQEKKAS